MTWNEQLAVIPSKRGESTTRVFSKSDCKVEDRLLDLALVQVMDDSLVVEFSAYPRISSRT